MYRVGSDGGLWVREMVIVGWGGWWVVVERDGDSGVGSGGEIWDGEWSKRIIFGMVEGYRVGSSDGESAVMNSGE